LGENFQPLLPDLGSGYVPSYVLNCALMLSNRALMFYEQDSLSSQFMLILSNSFMLISLMLVSFILNYRSLINVLWLFP
jgi:hypothetical protein